MMKPNATRTEPWVNAEQAAEHLGVVTETVYRWRERKGLPAHKIGRLWKFQLSEIDEWVRAGGADGGTGKNGAAGINVNSWAEIRNGSFGRVKL